MNEEIQEDVNTQSTDAETQEPEKAEADGKTRIKPNTETYVNGHAADFIGHALEGLTLDQVKQVAEKVGVDHAKYAHLNGGQQRMNIGNRLRTEAKKDEAKAEDITIITDELKAENEQAAATAKAEKEAA